MTMLLLSNSDEISNPILIQNTESIQSELPNQDAENNFHIKEVNEVALIFTNAEKPNMKQYVKSKIFDSNDTTDTQIKGKADKAT